MTIMAKNHWIMYNFKLIDVVIQGATLLSGLVLLFAFGATGYFFWISLCLVVWILISLLLNLLFAKPLSNQRKMVTLVLSTLFFGFLVAYLFNVSIARLNFYYKPLSLVVIISYLYLSFSELNKMKSKGEVDLDF